MRYRTEVRMLYVRVRADWFNFLSLINHLAKFFMLKKYSNTVIFANYTKILAIFDM